MISHASLTLLICHFCAYEWLSLEGCHHTWVFDHKSNCLIACPNNGKEKLLMCYPLRLYRLNLHGGLIYWDGLSVNTFHTSNSISIFYIACFFLLILLPLAHTMFSLITKPASKCGHCAKLINAEKVWHIPICFIQIQVESDHHAPITKIFLLWSHCGFEYFLKSKDAGIRVLVMIDEQGGKIPVCRWAKMTTGRFSNDSSWFRVEHFPHPLFLQPPPSPARAKPDCHWLHRITWSNVRWSFHSFACNFVQGICLTSFEVWMNITLITLHLLMPLDCS